MRQMGRMIGMMWACDPAEAAMCLVTAAAASLMLGLLLPLLVLTWIAPEEESAEETEKDQ